MWWDFFVPEGVVGMERWVEWQLRLAPEAIRLTQERYGLLRELRHEGMKGRRTLAQKLGMTERIARQHIDFLKTAGLVDSNNGGVWLTEDGEDALGALGGYVRNLSGMTALEERLSEALELKEVIVVPGDSDQDESILQDLGRAGAEILLHYMMPQSVVAVGGGSTLAQVAKGVRKQSPEVMVVPARGGLGENVEVQANTIAAVLAQGLGGQYRMLHIPDGLTEKAVKLVLESSPDMREIAELIRQADILIQGIGRADEMAKRRRTQSTLLKKIKSSGAVGEAMGYYFDREGRAVYETGSLGMKFSELNKIRFVMAVSGGSTKGAAILSVLRAGGQKALVTDEGAALEILKLIKGK
jgi:Transcriptional regulator, contains sigma factor-related N-terminal domain